MMHGTVHKYIKGTNVVGFVKPYAKGYSYVALLPKKGMSLKAYVKKLDGDTFTKLVSKAQDVTVHVAMPKYSVSYTNESMEQQLAAMGMPRAFQRNADFTKMGTDTSGGLYIGSVVHKTKVDVDEAGTKAAAATAVMMKASSAPDFDAKRVTLNRPFVYAIVDNATSLPVFIGTVSNIGK
jgi:serpin B